VVLQILADPRQVGDHADADRQPARGVPGEVVGDGVHGEGARGTGLEGLLGRRVDLVLVEDAEENPALLAEAVAEGRVLVDREPRWPELSARRAALARRSKRLDRERRREALARIDEFLA